MILAFPVIFTLAVLTLCGAGSACICRMDIPSPEIIRGGMPCAASVLSCVFLWIADTGNIA